MVGLFAFIKLIIIAALVKLLFETGKVWMCAAALAGVTVLWGLATGLFPAALLEGLILFVAAFGYFFLLDRMQGSSVVWIIAVVGALILVVI